MSWLRDLLFGPPRDPLDAHVDRALLNQQAIQEIAQTPQGLVYRFYPPANMGVGGVTPPRDPAFNNMNGGKQQHHDDRPQFHKKNNGGGNGQDRFPPKPNR